VPEKNDRVILALDGHDGAGKTTLGRRLAEALEVPYLRPFGGAGGQRLLADSAGGRFADVSCAAREMVGTALTSVHAPVVVFDRHWMTAFTLVDETWWDAWFPLPPTLLCWADLATTLQRLTRRHETPADVSAHAHYVAVYRALAERFGCDIVRTDLLDEEGAFAIARDWADGVIARTGASPCKR